jgi:hypothetical protein
MLSRTMPQVRSPLKGSKTFMTMQNVSDLTVIGAGPAGIGGATTVWKLGGLCPVWRAYPALTAQCLRTSAGYFLESPVPLKCILSSVVMT